MPNPEFFKVLDESGSGKNQSGFSTQEKIILYFLILLKENLKTVSVLTLLTLVEINSNNHVRISGNC